MNDPDFTDFFKEQRKTNAKDKFIDTLNFHEDEKDHPNAT
jgi:hypothetical protein